MLNSALEARGLAASATDLRAYFAPWPRILERTGSTELADDPDFDRLAEGTLADVFDGLPVPDHASDAVALVFGPGAALAPHDVLWYMNTPKRCAEAAVAAGTARNLGQGEDDGPPTTKRLCR
ncbi:hypothetical protein [Streptomyces sp900116325]|uniref:hypothetical protein n=1 Tax=Streptomyces sp. 900116325 TaxID=3154295 RepID=UPI0033DC434D